MRRVLLLCWLVCSVCTTLAQTPTADRHALIVGISTYQDRNLRSLSAARLDVGSARQMAAAMGVPSTNITVLQDAQATQEAIQTQLTRLTQSLTTSGRAFVYFSGYGARALNPATNACAQGVLTYEGHWLSHQALGQSLQGLAERADKLTVVLDAGYTAEPGAASGKTVRVPGGREWVSKATVVGNARACAGQVVERERALPLTWSESETQAQNVVFIHASRNGQVSWDEVDGGSLATQALRNCMLGDAQDLDRSGAVSFDEIQVCAAQFIKRKTPFGGPTDLEIVGNRHLVPVVRIQEAGQEVLGAYLASLSTERTQSVGKQSLFVPAQGAVDASAAAATMDDIYRQRDPRKRVEVTFANKRLRIRRDELQFTVNSNTPGYLYVFSLGSDARSFYMLFPHAHNLRNDIGPGRPVRPDPLVSHGPAGTNRLLFVVTERKRNFVSNDLREPSKDFAFAQSLNTPQGRQALIELTLGAGASNPGSRFGAALHEVEEFR